LLTLLVYLPRLIQPDNVHVVKEPDEDTVRASLAESLSENRID